MLCFVKISSFYIGNFPLLNSNLSKITKTGFSFMMVQMMRTTTKIFFYPFFTKIVSNMFKGNPLPMNRRDDRTRTPSYPSSEGLPYSQGVALFTSIVETGVFFKLHMWQIACVANCMYCKLLVLQIAHVVN